MERGRRDRRGSSPSREARAALLSSIAQRRAEKSSSRDVAFPSLFALGSPLPDSDESSSEPDESVSSSATVESPRIAASKGPFVKQNKDPVGGVLDTLVRLSLGSSEAPNIAPNLSSGLSQDQISSTSVQAEERGLSGRNAANRKAAGNLSKAVVDLSSDEEEEVFQQKPSMQKRQIINPAIASAEKFEFKEAADDDWLKSAEDADLVIGEGAKKYVLRGKIASKLYEHQRSGIQWLWSLHLKRMGGILGDDMGLGKTMQIASFLAGLFSAKLIRTAMVVAPKTLISHWVKELTIVGLSSKTHSYIETTSRARNNTLHKVLQMGGVLLTTYDMVRCNLSALKGDIHGRDGYGDTSEDITTWDYLVLDEGHLIKNPSTGRAMSLRELPSTHRIIISGTPIQNNLKEMWALMDFCCPGLLGDKTEFKRKFESQIVAGNEKHASDREKRLGVAVAKELRQKIAPFFLRRMKSEVFFEKENAETPKLSRKNDLIVWLQLTTCQEHLYRAFLESEAVNNALDTSRALTALSVLKKICDHPSLLTKRAAEDIAEGMEGMMGNDDRVEAQAMTATLAGLAEDLGCGESKDGDVSCKIAFLLVLLDKLVKEGCRTLIFSQTRKMLNIIQEEFEERKWDYRRIDGTMKSSERELAVEDFQTNPDIPFFLLTSQVGGLGLTLTAADRVVIVDPAWNPSVDNQSVDRAYRIGQKKDVTVYRLMTSGTLEEKIYRKQVFKGGLMKVATEAKNQMRYFSHQELHDLFRVPATGFSVSATQKQLAEEHFGEHQSTKELEEHIHYLEGLSMITGVSHHDVLYSKAAPPLPPPADDQDDTNVKWEPRNASQYKKNPKSASKAEESYTWDKANDCQSRLQSSGQVFDEAKHAWLRVSFFKDKIQRLAATLEDEGTVSKLADGGAKIVKKIKELTGEMEKLKVTAAPFEQSLSSSSNVSKRVASGHDENAPPERFEQGTTGQGLPAVVNLGDPVVRVRSVSGNNIYNTGNVGTDMRKAKVPGVVNNLSESRVENLEDVMSALRV